MAEPRLSVAVVTGGARGLGRAIAGRLADDGHPVAVSSRDAEAAERAAAELTAGGRRVALGVRADVRSAADVAVLADTATTLGPIGVWVNNAGYWATADTTELDDAAWDDVLATNLSGTFYGCREAARRMDAGGAVVNVASVIGVVGIARRAAYATSKAGVVGLTRALAAEWGHRGIRVNAVAPGFVEGDHGPEPGDDYGIDDITRRTPLGRFITRREVAAGVSYLCGAGSVTGEVLVIDGGWVADGGWAARTR